MRMKPLPILWLGLCQAVSYDTLFHATSPRRVQPPCEQAMRMLESRTRQDSTPGPDEYPIRRRSRTERDTAKRPNRAYHRHPLAAPRRRPFCLLKECLRRTCLANYRKRPTVLQPPHATTHKKAAPSPCSLCTCISFP